MLAPRAVTFQAAVEALELGVEGFERCVDALRRRPGLVLLDSRAVDGRLGRFSFACFDPFATLVARDGQVELRRWTGERATLRGKVLDVVERLLAAHRLEVDAGGLPAPFVGGAAGYLGYGLAGELERLPRAARDASGAPDAVLGLYDRVLVLDRGAGRAYLACLASPDLPGRAPLGEVRRAVLEAARRGTAPDDAAPDDAAPDEPLSRDLTRDAYLAAVRRIQDHVAAGDAYQVNFTGRWFAPARGRDPWALHRRLMRLNPAPFAAWLGFDAVQVSCASPERFLRVDGAEVETRPIKGTAPRGATPEEDARLRAALLASAKDRAELAMIVDVARNDLGRVCAPGSVRVDAFPEVERHPSVHHLVATVRGRLAPGRGVCDLLRAAFPAASITGAPKIRAMEIVDELEPVARGVYTGSIGYLGFQGTADLNVAIRTIVVAGGHVHLHAGGGIVADSVPEAEHGEAELKARNLIRAVASWHEVAR
ncbi:para-aminobenzoate synthase, subunit I [Anaeromyxobacter dehalogenans 2CP-1]|uniref:aminodeoxychorismate synthase n=1 Tax=Anaeromyxobacter dehalogenans (strain ATCC BAA-258 / DSM 21875 / 2CP-1) TaxID=455488 RepID=B8J9G3_ANAD2|nr:aminodeoxychorismate synthase component I [Anaeromyxobacter dehalogenans]ACL67351.1 para-aminobenzoate synthase, subunit I [Anaeromyxobacter dehalogenans 2CP-1]